MLLNKTLLTCTVNPPVVEMGTQITVCEFANSRRSKHGWIVPLQKTCVALGDASLAKLCEAALIAEAASVITADM